MQATGLYDSAAGGLGGIRRTDGASRTGDPLCEQAVAGTVRDQYVPQGMLCIGSASGACPEWIGIDAPILRDRDSDADGETGDLGRTGSGLDERLYYLTDAHMNVTAVTNTTGAVVERYHYDPYPNSRHVHTTYGDGDANDVLSRVAAIRNDNAGSPGATVFAAYSYDGAGRVVVEDYAQPDVRLDRVDVTTWATTPGTYAGLDPFDRLMASSFGRVRQQWWRDYGAAADVDKLAYGYDRNSNRLYRENVVSGSQGTPVHLDELYHYDRLNRLQDANRGDLNGNHNAVSSTSLRQAWTLDDLGNWSAFKTDADGSAPWATEQARTHNPANEITAIDQSSTHVAHDARGNMTKAPVPGDEAAHHYVCTYDAWNRLVKVQTDDETPVTVAAYRYDGLHRRVAKLVPNSGTPANWDRTDYYYAASWQVLEERFAPNQEDADTVAKTAKYQYVWSLRYIDACILRDEDVDLDGDWDDAGTGGFERLYYTNGANMEVTALLNTSGTVVERYVYGPYGQPTIYNPSWSATVSWASSKKNEILFGGYRYDNYSNDSMVGLYNARLRHYHPALGRWTTRDPAGYIHSLTLYCYGGSGPTGSVDPLGLAPRTPAEIEDDLFRLEFAPRITLDDLNGLCDQASVLSAELSVSEQYWGVPQNIGDLLSKWLRGNNSGQDWFGPDNPLTQAMADPVSGSPGIKDARDTILAAMAAHCGQSGVDGTTWGSPTGYDYTGSPEFRRLLMRSALRGPIGQAEYIKDIFTIQHIVAGYDWTALVNYRYDPDECRLHVDMTFEIKNTMSKESAFGFIPEGHNLLYNNTVRKLAIPIVRGIQELEWQLKVSLGGPGVPWHQGTAENGVPRLKLPRRAILSALGLGNRTTGPQKNYTMHMVWTESHSISCPCPKD